MCWFVNLLTHKAVDMKIRKIARRVKKKSITAHLKDKTTATSLSRHIMTGIIPLSLWQ